MADQTDGYRAPRSVEELTEQNVGAVAGIERAEEAKRTATDRAVDGITAFCGTMAFVWVHVAWFGFWVGVNALPFVPKHWRFDPYPFQFLTLAVSLEAIFLSTFILISQNRAGRLADRRNRLDLQVNLLSEQENTKMLSMLDAIQKRLGIEDRDPDVSVLEQATRPERLVEQIQSASEGKPSEEG